MGYLADDMINGVCCSLCGCYFRDQERDDIYEHGYPVVCWSCCNNLTDEEQEGYVKVDVPTY